MAWAGNANGSVAGRDSISIVSSDGRARSFIPVNWRFSLKTEPQTPRIRTRAPDQLVWGQDRRPGAA